MGQVERLIEQGLVYRPETSEGLYALTPLGVFFSEFVVKYGELILDVLDHVEEAEQEARGEFEDMPVGEDTLERLVTERKWELVSETMQDLMEAL